MAFKFLDDFSIVKHLIHETSKVIFSFAPSFLILANLRQLGDESLTKGDTHENHETVDLNKLLFNCLCHELELFVDLVK